MADERTFFENQAIGVPEKPTRPTACAHCGGPLGTLPGVGFGCVSVLCRLRRAALAARENELRSARKRLEQAKAKSARKKKRTNFSAEEAAAGEALNRAESLRTERGERARRGEFHAVSHAEAALCAALREAAMRAGELAERYEGV